MRAPGLEGGECQERNLLAERSLSLRSYPLSEFGDAYARSGDGLILLRGLCIVRRGVVVAWTYELRLAS